MSVDEKLQCVLHQYLQTLHHVAVNAYLHDNAFTLLCLSCSSPS